jgi:hypothetical protein
MTVNLRDARLDVLGGGQDGDLGEVDVPGHGGHERHGFGDVAGLQDLDLVDEVGLSELASGSVTWSGSSVSTMPGSMVATRMFLRPSSTRSSRVSWLM